MVNGAAIAGCRKRRGLTQEQLAELAGIAVDTLCRLEQGRRSSARLSTLQKLAYALGVDTAAILVAPAAGPSSDTVTAPAARDAEESDMERRDLLRVISAATVAVSLTSVTPPVSSMVDLLGAADVVRLNAATKRLWSRFGAAPAKAPLYAPVRRHLRRLTSALRRPQRVAARRELLAAAADTFQLAGEVLFDKGRYSDAAHCYTLAATAAREADAFDLWACALTRHAYISIYEQRPTDALPLLELATQIGRRGDSTSSTRHWTAAVLAQTLAETGDHAGCERALEYAERVTGLPRPHNGGWLRFDGSRLHEDRAACYLKQRRPDLAEPLLTQLLATGQPGRRRAISLTDLTLAGTQLKDPLRVVTHGFAATDLARSTGSGVIARKLANLLPALSPMRSDPHVHHLAREITDLTTTRAT